jgi:hypothetical protein
MDATCRIVGLSNRGVEISLEMRQRVCNDSRRIVEWKEFARSTLSPPSVSAGIDAVVQACCKDAEQL